jgi:arginase
MHRFATIEAPSMLGLMQTGVDRLPRALLDAGLGRRLSARSAGKVTAPPYDAQRDPVTGILNTAGIAAFTKALADQLGPILNTNEFPIVLGGDCSILLGSLLALRRRGRFGLLFLDAHADFYEPEANINGEAASSELAFATGRGPKELTEFDGFRPLIRDDDIVAFGIRDEAEQEEFHSQPLPDNLMALNLSRVRNVGAAGAAQLAVEHLTRPHLGGFWIHLDVDVLADEIMPAVDYRIPGGLVRDELLITLKTALRSEHAVGLEVTIFNPTLDHDGQLAQMITDLLVESLS